MKHDVLIPASVLRMAIVMVNAAEQCDQAGQWDRDHRRACQHILDWIGSNDYKITCEKAGVSSKEPAVGYWNRYDDCSVCGARRCSRYDNFCANCGFKMIDPYEKSYLESEDKDAKKKP